MKKKSTKIKYQHRNQKPITVAEVSALWSVKQLIKHSPKSFYLNYNNKIDEVELFTNIPNSSIKETASHGQLNFNKTTNYLINGDNLIVLKNLLLNPEISQKVKLVYIDPPFATKQSFRTGNGRTATISSSEMDELAYSDHLIGPEFLEFLRRRLILLRELLADDGSIYVHIDAKMGHYLKIIMDEVFGKEHFINDITRIKCNPKNFSRKGYGNIKDMILFYSKTNHFIWNEPRKEMNEEDILRLFPKIDKDGRRYTTTPLHAPGETKNGATGQPWNDLFPPPGRHWRNVPKELNKLEKAGLIEWSSSGNPRKKIFADEVLKKGKKIQDVWELKDPQYPYYPTEKNLDLLKQIIEASSNPNDLILDCFAGSGTTLIAAEKLGRQWIGIDNSKVAISIAIKRLKEISQISLFTVLSCNQIQEEKVEGIK